MTSDIAQNPNNGQERRKFRAKSWLLRLVGLLAIGYGLWLFTLLMLQERLIFPSYLASWAVTSTVPRGAEVVTLTAEDGSKVPAWLFRPEVVDSDDPVPVLVWFHGNAEVIDQVAGYREIELFRELGLAVLIPEFRGYGRAEGSPTQEAIVSDMVRFVASLDEQKGLDTTQVVYLGRSLGGGVAVAVAERRAPKALILQSTFTSIASFATRYLAPEALVRHPFRTDEVLPALDVPVLIFHGRADQVVPVEHGRAIAKLAKRGEYIEDDSDHFNLPRDWAAYTKVLRDFLLAEGVLSGR